MTNYASRPRYAQVGGSWFSGRNSARLFHHNFNTLFFRYEELSVRLARRVSRRLP